MQERTTRYTLRPCDAQVLRSFAARLLRVQTITNDNDVHAAAAVDMIAHCAHWQGRSGPCAECDETVSVVADRSRPDAFRVPGASVAILPDDTVLVTWDEEEATNASEPVPKRVRREGP
jgi:hypothetical protein